jgi:selenocysteine lyase/cysteine desulfurase
VLVARRELVRNRVPTVPGGGTVAYVNPTEHRYLEDPVEREEGGTPAIVESIRAGLVFQLKQAVGADTIQALERSFIGRAVESWGANPNIELLGNLEAERLSIVSFTVRHGPRYLHHNFVVALLNDLFGIQSRGGCSCAGPYGHRLLGIDIESRPSTWSPTRAGSCSATTASTPPPACGATARARSSPPAPG